MLRHLHDHLAYSQAVVNALQKLVDDGVVTAERALAIRVQLADQDRVAATLERLREDALGGVAGALATNCMLLFHEASLQGDEHARDFLKLAARAVLLDEEAAEDEAAPRVSLRDASRADSWRSEYALSAVCR